MRREWKPAAAQQRLALVLGEIDASLKALDPEKAGPGCSYAASKKGQILFNRSYGMAELEHDVPLTEKAVFNAASIAKQFTAAAILLLVQDGKLGLSDDIRKYLPEMPVYRTLIVPLILGPIIWQVDFRVSKRRINCRVHRSTGSLRKRQNRHHTNSATICAFLHFNFRNNR